MCYLEVGDKNGSIVGGQHTYELQEWNGLVNKCLGVWHSRAEARRFGEQEYLWMTWPKSNDFAGEQMASSGIIRRHTFES